MISKENFVKYINKSKKLKEIEDVINNAAKELESFKVNFYDHEQLILGSLRDAFDDEGNDLISYFIYDLEYGSRWTPGKITENGKDIKLSTAEELYDELIRNMDK